MSEAEWIAFLQRPEIPAFNRAMLDNPDDDLPRLVFADWMDENCPDTEVNAVVRRSITGDDKRELWPGLPQDGDVQLGLVRGRALLRIDSDDRPSGRRTPRFIWEAVWRSGWVDTLLNGSTKFETLRDWWRNDPMEGVREVALIAHHLSARRLRSLLSSPRLKHLSSLGLACWRFPEEFVAAITRSCVLPRLRSLAINSDGLQFEQFTELLVSAPLEKLEDLTITGTCLGDHGAAALAVCPSLANLRTLLFDDRALTAVGAAILADSPYLCESIRAQWRRTDDGGANR